MTSKFYSTTVLSLFVAICFTQCRTNTPSKGVAASAETNAVVALAEHQVTNQLSTLKPKSFPKTTNPDGTVGYERWYGWASGFFPGVLWELNELTGDQKWETEARRMTAMLDTAQYVNVDHDMGFRMYCSYGRGYRMTKDPYYKKVLMQSAETLLKRYNPTVGLIKSWDSSKSWDGKTVWRYPVIIDNMMNLELLMFAYNESKDEKFRQVAISHADHTLKDFYRPDNSSYHVVAYDVQTGKVEDKATYQGFADNSSWARGQAWGLYGFTVMYRETRDVKYLNHAKKIADYIMNSPRLPEDKIPYWDYHAGQPGYTPEWKYNAADFKVVPRDASAAAVTSSALYELSTHVPALATKYKAFADDIVKSLSKAPYMAKEDSNNNFILEHSVGSIPHGVEIDVPLIYADYYFLESLIRQRELATTGKLIY